MSKQNPFKNSNPNYKTPRNKCPKACVGSTQIKQENVSD